MKLPDAFTKSLPAIRQFIGFAVVSLLLMALTLVYINTRLLPQLFINKTPIDNIWEQICSYWLISISGALLIYLFTRPLLYRLPISTALSELQQFTFNWWLITILAIVIGGYSGLQLMIRNSAGYQQMLRVELDYANHNDHVERLLAVMMLCNQQQRDEQLIVATYRGNDAICYALCGVGVTREINRALLITTKRGDQSLFDLLLKHGSNRGFVSSSSLTSSLFYSHHELIQSLLDRGADLKTITQSSDNALVIRTESEYQSCLKALLIAAAKLDIRGPLGETLLHLAIENNNSDEVRMLLEDPAGRVLINSRDRFNITPLHVAVLSNNPFMMESLLKLKTELNIRDDQGATPLGLATTYHRDEMAKLLKNAGAIEIRPNTAIDVRAEMKQPRKDQNILIRMLVLELRRSMVRPEYNYIEQSQ